MTFELQPRLTGKLIELRPLTRDDFDALYSAASDPLIWEQHPEPDRYKPEVFQKFFDGALESKGALAVIERASGRIIGSSRYCDLNPAASQVEIGWTFLERKFWGGSYNAEMKALMLEHALRFVDRVVFLVGENNLRSQMALRKIGARFVRSEERPAADGTTKRNVVFAITRRDRADRLRRGAANFRGAWWLAFAGCVVSVLVSIAYVDRPVAEFAYAHWRHSALYVAANGFLWSLPLALIVALALLFAAGVRAYAGRPLGAWSETPLLCAWAAVWALSCAIVLKIVFGRSWPEPGYLVEHIYEFLFLRGRSGFESFPSGTMSASGAIIGVLWTRVPSLRMLYAAALVVIAFALVVVNGHWVADIIAGAYLGVVIGRLTVATRRAD